MLNNYSYIQQLFHKIVLSSDLIKEFSFDIEKNLFFKKCENLKDNHVFISGLARSGTTILLNAIYKSNNFASLTYNDMPFILAPNFWSKINRKKTHQNSIERAHGDGIKISSNSPEAFEEVFWKLFCQKNKSSIIEFYNYIKLILYKNNKKRYLSKNNQNVKRLNLIIKYFPNSKILIPYRDPLQQSFSLLTQHRKFIKIQKTDKFIKKYMNWIGHSEFGLDYKPIRNIELEQNNYNKINHWLEQWMLIYNTLYELNTNQQVKFVCYEKLCENASLWNSLQKFINIKNKKKIKFVESKKNIKIQYNRQLLDECYNLYNKLQSIEK